MQITRLLLRRRCALKLRECPQLLQQNRNLINISRKISMTTKQLIETAGRNSISWVNFSVSRYCTPSVKEQELIDISTFEKICDETLDSLTEYFEELVEKAAHLEAADVSYGVRNYVTAFLGIDFDCFRAVCLLLLLGIPTARM